MELNLSKPIVFFDLETTGISITKDRIVEIAILKIFPNGNKESKTWLVNPEIQIPKEASDIHGITNEKVANEPTFKELASQINEMIKGCDLAGFNSSRFDIPLLAEELLRVGLDFDMKNRAAVDVQVIFFKKEQRTLTAAYQFYCNQDLTNAHSAMADTTATYEVLKAQLDKYDDLENNISFLNSFSQFKKNADFANMIVFDEADDEVFNFGKHKGKKVTDVFEKEPGYYAWIQKSDFPLYTKKILTAIKLRSLNNKL